MNTCVRRAKLPRKDFLEKFTGKEDDLKWVPKMIKAGHDGLKPFEDEIVRAQKKIKNVAEATGLAVTEIKDINAACLSVKQKPAGKEGHGRKRPTTGDFDCEEVHQPGLQFPDLIQEGNIGLMKAVTVRISSRLQVLYLCDLVDPSGDHSFNRGPGTNIRIPVHMIETINKLSRISRQMLQEMGREPTPEELGVRMDMPEEKVRRVLKIAKSQSLWKHLLVMMKSHLGDFLDSNNNLSELPSVRRLTQPPMKVCKKRLWCSLV